MGDRPEDWVEPKILELKQGVDEELEADADKLLMESVRPNERSTKRDWEKLHYEFGRIAEEDLAHYDPRNDWETQDSAFSVPVRSGALDFIEPSLCAGVGDGNVRARNPKMLERQRLMHNVRDSDDWGSAHEEIPLLGVNEITAGKVCVKCGLRKRCEYFSPNRQNKDGLHSFCKSCRALMSRKRRSQRKKKRS